MADKLKALKKAVADGRTTVTALARESGLGLATVSRALRGVGEPEERTLRDLLTAWEAMK